MDWGAEWDAGWRGDSSWQEDAGWRGDSSWQEWRGGWWYRDASSLERGKSRCWCWPWASASMLRGVLAVSLPFLRQGLGGIVR